MIADSVELKGHIETKRNWKSKMLVELLIISVGLICYSFYKLSTNSAKYFEERNLKYAGLFSQLKTLLSLCFGTIDILTTMENMYDAFPDVP